jgi:23S rRNA (pseudouridine1915-N3)-methyltransferase
VFKVKVITVGKSKEIWLKEALQEYEKRLSSTLTFEWLIAKDRMQLIDWAKNETALIALDLKGELLSSEVFSQKLLRSLVEKGGRLSFLIGDADGIPQELLNKCFWKWCLSPLTFTHQMARLLLVEQIYRALEIEKKSGYHK